MDLADEAASSCLQSQLEARRTELDRKIDALEKQISEKGKSETRSTETRIVTISVEVRRPLLD